MTVVTCMFCNSYNFKSQWYFGPFTPVKYKYDDTIIDWYPSVCITIIVLEKWASKYDIL